MKTNVMELPVIQVLIILSSNMLIDLRQINLAVCEELSYFLTPFLTANVKPCNLFITDHI